MKEVNIVDDSLILKFGKYKNKHIVEVINEDMKYCKWLFNQKKRLINYPLVEEILKNEFIDPDSYYMTFGKHKGKSLKHIFHIDKKYILYLRFNENINNSIIHEDLANAVNNLPFVIL